MNKRINIASLTLIASLCILIFSLFLFSIDVILLTLLISFSISLFGMFSYGIMVLQELDKYIFNPKIHITKTIKNKSDYRKQEAKEHINLLLHYLIPFLNIVLMFATLFGIFETFYYPCPLKKR